MKKNRKGLSKLWNAILAMGAILILAIVFALFAQPIVQGITSLAEALKVLLSSGPMLIAMGAGMAGLWFFIQYLQKHSGKIDREAFKYIAVMVVAGLYLWKGWQLAVINIFGYQVTISDEMFSFLVMFFAGLFSMVAFYLLKKKRLI